MKLSRLQKYLLFIAFIGLLILWRGPQWFSAYTQVPSTVLLPKELTHAQAMESLSQQLDEEQDYAVYQHVRKGQTVELELQQARTDEAQKALEEKVRALEGKPKENSAQAEQEYAAALSSHQEALASQQKSYAAVLEAYKWSQVLSEALSRAREAVSRTAQLQVAT